MTESHLIERKISIDAGHRVMTHGSKCAHIHGHNYIVYAVCEGPLAEEGEQTGMVLDFGFLKEIMMNEIDHFCDHGFIAYIDDMPVLKMFEPNDYQGAVSDWYQELKYGFDEFNSVLRTDCAYGSKVYFVDFIPTAENLARHWYKRLAPQVIKRSNGLAKIHKVIVWETRNCSASYPS